MALGRGNMGGGDDYYSMISNAGKQGMATAKNITGLYQQGLQTGEKEQELGRRDQARQLFGEAWSSGDSLKVHAVMQMFPEFAEKAQKMLGIQDDQQRKDVGNMAYTLQGLIQAGDVDGAKGLVGQNSALFSKFGGADHILAALDGAKGEGEAAGAERQRIGHWLHSLEGVSLSGQEREQNRQGDVKLDQGWQGLQQQLQIAQMHDATMRNGQNNMQSRLNRGTMAEQNFEFYNSLSPEEQQTFLRFMPGGRGAGVGGGMFAGPHTVQLANGETVQIDPKVHGSGDKAFYQGQDAAGNIINVPVSSVTTPVSSQENAGNAGMAEDIVAILNATPDDLEHITGNLRGGSVGEMPFGADTYTGYKGGAARELYSAAKRIQGNMQNKGIAAAKSMGASGINTVAEAKMYFMSMPQPDYSSPESLIKSINRVKQYTDNFNQQRNVNYGSKPGNGAPAVKNASPSGVHTLSDDELLGGL